MTVNRFWWVVVLLATGCASAATNSPTSPFTMNGWQLHDYNMPKLEEAVKKAPEYGVNFLIFSHEWFRSVEAFLDSTDDVDPAHPPANVGEAERSRFKWTGDPADEKLEYRMYHPDEAIYKQLLDEKDEVVKEAEESMEDINQARRYLTAEQYAPLKEDFAFLVDAADLQREWIRAYFAMRLYMVGTKGDPKYIKWMEEGLANLERYEKTPGATWGMNAETGRRYNVDKFELEMRWRVANRARALAEDKRILEQVKKEGDVGGN